MDKLKPQTYCNKTVSLGQFVKAGDSQKSEKNRVSVEYRLLCEVLS
jgi:hypothetical protein